MCVLGSYIKSLFENHGNENASPNCEVPGCHCAGKWRLAESFVSNCSMSAAGRERWQRQTTWSSVTIAQNKPLESNVAQVVARRSGLLACTAGGSKRKDILSSMCGRLRLQAAQVSADRATDSDVGDVLKSQFTSSPNIWQARTANPHLYFDKRKFLTK